MRKVIISMSLLCVLTSLTFGQVKLSALPKATTVNSADLFLMTQMSDETSHSITWGTLKKNIFDSTMTFTGTTTVNKLIAKTLNGDTLSVRLPNWDTAYSKRVDAWTYPLNYSNNVVSLLYNTSNLKLIGGSVLSTIQDITTTSSPVFYQLALSATSGTMPLTIMSTTKVTNLNADLVDGYRFNQSLLSTDSPTFSNLNLTSGGTYSINNVNILTSTALGTTVASSNLQSVGVLSSGSIAYGFGSINIGNNIITSGLINGQTVSTAANFTGTMTVAGNIQSYSLSPLNLNTGYIPYKSATLINSPIYTNGTNVLINSTVDNGNKFQVYGNTYLGGNVSQPTSSLYYSTNYASGWGNTGFSLSTDVNGVSNMILDNLTVRKTMSIYELLVREIRATNGNLFVSSTAKVTGSSGSSVTFNDETEQGVTPFAINDIVVAQRWNPQGTQVLSYSIAIITGLSGLTATVSYDASSANNFSVGDAVVRIGNTSDLTRQGSIYLAADDDNSPFIDVRDGVNMVTAWNSSFTKVRIGKLSGITDATFGALSGYGLYGQNVYLKGKIIISNPNDIQTSTLNNNAGWTKGATWGSDLSNIPIRFANAPSGSGLYLTGSYLGFYNGSTWKTYMDNTGDLYLTGTGTHSLSWNGSSLSIIGNITADGGSIGGWVINSNYIRNNNVTLNAQYGTIYVSKPSGGYISLGQTIGSISYTGYYGIAATDNSGNYLIRLDNNANQIAGTNFDATHIYNAGWSLYSDGHGSLANGNISWTSAGAVTLSSSVTISNTQVSGLGSLATKNTVTWNSSDITGTPSQLINFASTPSGSGLFLDASHLGYYSSGTWKTYMDNSGNFYLGGLSGALQWNGSTLSITGAITATSGSFAGSLNAATGTFNGTVTVGSSTTISPNVQSLTASQYSLMMGNYVSGSYNLPWIQLNGKSNGNGGFNRLIIMSDLNGGRLFADNGNTSSTLTRTIVGDLSGQSGSTNECGILVADFNSSGNIINTYLRLSDATKQIAGWTFDNAKLYKGTSSAGIVLNTSSTPFITGSGFEVYNPTNPMLFIGSKSGNSLDWNVTAANTLTIKGNFLSSTFSTQSIINDYGVLSLGVDIFGGTIQAYSNSSETNYLNKMYSTGITMTNPGHSLIITNNNFPCIAIDGNQVLAGQQSAIGDPTDAGSTTVAVKAILAAMRNHGLIAR